MPFPRPASTEAAEYYFRYIDRVPDDDVRRVLDAQLREAVEFLREFSDERSLHRYEEAKWSVREVLGHLNDTERLFAFRAFWFARGVTSPLPSFDPNTAVAAASFDTRAWPSLIDEFASVRATTLWLFSSLDDAAWARGGEVSGHYVTVRALAFIAAGHVAHHLAILREKYV